MSRGRPATSWPSRPKALGVSGTSKTKKAELAEALDKATRKATRNARERER